MECSAACGLCEINGVIPQSLFSGGTCPSFKPSVRYLTSLSRAPQDLEYCPCSRTPELQFVGRLTALNSMFNIVKVSPNNVDCPVTMPVDQASSGNPGDPVHRERIGVESLRQVKLTTCAAHTPARFFGAFGLQCQL
jgi:hypothetical protein